MQSRFLFIFDTSKEMKPRLPAAEKALNTMLATSLRGELHAGDSMGVWTFGQNLQTKGYPLQSWNPDAAVAIASNLVKFVDEQHYAKTARYEMLQPLLNRVVQDSERLTVLVFCDGGGKISGTPYDAAISQVFKEKLGEQKNAQQPFVVVFRSQLGQYVGCAMTLPPQLLNIPTVPAVAGTAAAAETEAHQCAAAREGGHGPTAHHHRQKAGGERTATGDHSAACGCNPRRQPIRAWQKDVGSTPAIPPVAPAENSKSGNSGFMLIGAGLLGAAIAFGLAFWLRPRRT